MLIEEYPGVKWNIEIIPEEIYDKSGQGNH